MKTHPITSAVALTLGTTCAATATAAELDRTVLPIPQPKRPLYTQLDVRDVPLPPLSTWCITLLYNKIL